MTATIWRSYPSYGSSFEQPDDPGRKQVYCSRACQRAAYRSRQRTSAGQRTGGQDWRCGRHGHRRQRPGSQRPGADQHYLQRWASTTSAASSASRRWSSVSVSAVEGVSGVSSR